MPIKITRKAKGADTEGRSRFGRCRIVNLRLETGENLKRGCGLSGLDEVETGWRCFYCGNHIYRSGLPLDALWSHFKTGREYWRLAHVGGRDFVNGVPVTGDDLPPWLLVDLKEIRPPQWFAYYLIYDERDFKLYLQINREGLIR